MLDRQLMVAEWQPGMASVASRFGSFLGLSCHFPAFFPRLQPRYIAMERLRELWLVTFEGACFSEIMLQREGRFMVSGSPKLQHENDKKRHSLGHFSNMWYLCKLDGRMPSKGVLGHLSGAENIPNNLIRVMPA